MTYIVALTGGIGSGKSTVSDLFKQRGVEIIDADIIARQVIEPGSEALLQLSQHFGQSILLTDGTLDRAKLRKLIFSDPQNKIWVEKLMHPLIQQITQQQISEVKAAWCIWVVPLLVENHLYKYASRVLVIDTDPSIQLQRIILRDNITPSEAQNILNAQAIRQQRLAIADDVINNDGGLSDVVRQVDSLFQLYNKAALQSVNKD